MARKNGELSRAAEWLIKGKLRDGHVNGNGSAETDSDRRLRDAIQRYVDLYDFAPVAFVSLDRAGRIEEANHAATLLLNRSRAQLVGAPFALHVMKEDSSLFLNHLLRCRSSERQVETELRLKKRNGKTITAHLSSTPLSSSTGNGARLFQTAIVDLTERKQAEEAIRESGRRYRTLFDFVPVAVYTCDAKGYIQEFNQRAVKLWGRRPKTGQSAEKYCGSFKIFYPDGRPMPHERCPMARALRGEKLKPDDLEILVERQSGTRRIVLVNPTALKDERGKIIGAINCLHDVTERKKAEAALRESEDLHRALVNQTAVGMVRSNLKGRLVFVNQKLCEMLGYKKGELTGRTISEITHPDDVHESKKLFQRLVRDGVPYHIEKRYLRKDGSDFWVTVNASPMRDAKGKPESAVAVVLDMTDRKKAERLLEERARGLEGEILEISDREQRRLGQDLHDSLCQHLTATAFMARALGERMRIGRDVDPKELDKICDLINDGVTEARTIARGLHPVEMDPAGLAAALQSLLNRQSNFPYRLDMEDDFKISDPTVALHLYRIAREAVINANKHAGTHELVVRMRSLPGRIELSVSDDGSGLPPNSGDSSGMGFHIMQYRARSIGARLEIKSIKPHGTRVACYLPRK